MKAPLAALGEGRLEIKDRARPSLVFAEVALAIARVTVVADPVALVVVFLPVAGVGTISAALVGVVDAFATRWGRVRPGWSYVSDRQWPGKSGDSRQDS